MDFSLSEAEQDLADLCRDFAQREIVARAPQAWEEARCPTDLLREMGELGLLGTLVPEQWGGIGMTTVGFVAAMEQLGLSMLPVFARALALPLDFFAPFFVGCEVTVRLLHYPPATAEHVARSIFGHGAHTDNRTLAGGQWAGQY